MDYRLKFKFLWVIFFLWFIAPGVCQDSNIESLVLKRNKLSSSEIKAFMIYCNDSVFSQTNAVKPTLERLDSIIQKDQLTQLENNLWFLLGKTFFALTKYDSSLLYMQKVDLQKTLDFENENFEIYYYMGAAFFRIGEYEKAKTMLNIASIKIVGDNKLEFSAKVNHELGRIATEQGDYTAALLYFQESLNDYRKNNDPDGVAKMNNNIASLFSSIENYQFATDYYLKALEYYQLTNNLKGKASILNNLGTVQESMGNYKQAFEYYSNSFNLYESLGNLEYQGVIKNNLGVVSQKLGRYNEAQAYFDKALSIKQKLNDKRGVASVLHNIGEMYADRSQFDWAEKYFLQSLNEAKSIGSIDFELKVVKSMAESYANAKNFDKAYHYQLMLKELTDKYLSEGKNSQINELEAKFQNEQKEKENIELKYQNELDAKKIIKQRYLVLFSFLLLIILISVLIIIYRANKVLRKKNLDIERKQAHILYQNELLQEQKDQLIQANKVKNHFFSVATQNLWEPVGTIKNLLEHLLFIKDKEDSRTLASYIKTSKDASVSALNLLENLLFWARLQQSEIVYEPEYYSLNTLLLNVVKVQEPRATSKLVVIKTDIDDTLTVYADKVLMEIAFRNLIENAIKFSTRGGEVMIRANAEGSKIKVSILDSGVGMTREQISTLFSKSSVNSTPGTHGEKGGGLGLIITKAFIERNFGKIEARSSIAEGSAIFVTLPSTKDRLL